MQNRGLLIYGSYGYSGDLITRRAIERGLSPILAGRDVNALRRQAQELALEHRVAPLNDSAALHTALQGVRTVLHCAGPFIHTSRCMADACVQAGAHYIDITGEISVFERLAARDGEARARGVMLLPGAGFDVVPTDCLAVHLAERLPGSTELVLAFESAGGISRGTASTVVEHIGGGSLVRRDGELRRVPLGHSTRMVDFGSGERLTVAHPWGDLSTAWRSTGIPNITVYRATSRAELRLMPVVRAGLPVLATRPAQRLLRTWVRRQRARPRCGCAAGWLLAVLWRGKASRRRGCGRATPRAGGVHADGAHGRGVRRTHAGRRRPSGLRHSRNGVRRGFHPLNRRRAPR